MYVHPVIGPEKKSETATPLASDGPLLVMFTAYTAEVPAVVALAPSDLDTLISAEGVRTVLLSVAVLLAALGSKIDEDTVALLDNVPVAPDAIAQLAV